MFGRREADHEIEEEIRHMKRLQLAMRTCLLVHFTAIVLLAFRVSRVENNIG